MSDPLPTNVREAVACSELLASLQQRFLIRANMAMDAKHRHVITEDYAAANDCLIREQVWKAAAQIVEEEKAANDKLTDRSEERI